MTTLTLTHDQKEILLYSVVFAFMPGRPDIYNEMRNLMVDGKISSEEEKNVLKSMATQVGLEGERLDFFYQILDAICACDFYILNDILAAICNSGYIEICFCVFIVAVYPHVNFADTASLTFTGQTASTTANSGNGTFTGNGNN